MWEPQTTSNFVLLKHWDKNIWAGQTIFEPNSLRYPFLIWSFNLFSSPYEWCLCILLDNLRCIINIWHGRWFMFLQLCLNVYTFSPTTKTSCATMSSGTSIVWQCNISECSAAYVQFGGLFLHMPLFGTIRIMDV